MNVPILRDYQAGMKARNYETWSRGIRHVVDVLPTGGGKSVVIGSHAADDIQSPGNNAIVAHRQELVSQMSMHIARFGVPHRIFGPRDVVAFISAQHRLTFGRSYVDPSAATAVAGVDTLIARAETLKPWLAQVKRWTVDEAHHLLRSNKWGKAVALMPNAFGLGVTATPNRADGNGIGDEANGGHGVFGAMVEGPTMRQLIDMGSLTDYEIAMPDSDIDVTKLKITDGGDYSPKALREASKNSHIVGDVVEWYCRLAWGKQGITFAVDIEDATAIAAKFNEWGIPAAAVSSETPDALRADLIQRFREGKLWQLVNVDLFGEGFDVPGVMVVSMARPTASLGVYLQQFGRVLRLLEGKRYGLVIDHVSNVKRHGLPDKPHVWTLASKERRARRVFDPDEVPVKKCPECVRGYPAILPACPYCGHEPVPAGGGRSVEQVDGDLTLLTAEALQALRNASVLLTPDQLVSQARFASGGRVNTQMIRDAQTAKIAAAQELTNAIALWAGHERARGRSDAESYRRFYHGTGGIDVLSALSLDRKEMQQLTENIRQWLS